MDSTSRERPLALCQRVLLLLSSSFPRHGISHCYVYVFITIQSHHLLADVYHRSQHNRVNSFNKYPIVLLNLILYYINIVTSDTSCWTRRVASTYWPSVSVCSSSRASPICVTVSHCAMGLFLSPFNLTFGSLISTITASIALCIIQINTQ